jgi:hypothetical protein
MMAAIKIGTPLEYGRPQGVLQHVKVKLARKAHADKMEVDGDERLRWHGS